MSLIRCFGTHATHMRNNRKKMYEILMENMRFTWENIFQLIFSYMRKIAKTHVLIWENLAKLISSYMRKSAKTHVLIWKNMVKLICEYMRKIAKNHMRICEKSLNHTLIYAKNRLRICEKSLKIICKNYVEIHLYIWGTQLKPMRHLILNHALTHMIWTLS